MKRLSLRMLIYGPFVGVFPLPMAAIAAIPRDAWKVIQEVHAAATNKDFAALRRLMVRDFQWSFGGDSDAERA